MADSNKKGNILKIICLGNVSTGKTSIIKRYTTNSFSNQYTTTIGVDFMLKHLKIGNNEVRVQFWDLAGQDRFSGLARAYYRHSSGAVVVFDVTNRDTFQSVINWKRDVDQKIELPNGQKLPVILLGNKCDLINESTEACVTDEEIQKFVEEHGFYKYYPASALANIGISEAMTDLIEEVTRRSQLNAEGGTTADFYHEHRNTTTAEPVNLNEKPKQSGGCC